MPDASSRMKRLPISGFGEGSVVKRQRNGLQDKPRSSDGRHPPVARAILSGPDSGFRAKPISLPAGGQKQPRRPALPSNPNEALAPFKTSRTAHSSAARPPPFTLPHADSPFKGPQTKPGDRLKSPAGRNVKQSSTPVAPLMNRAHPPNLRPKTPNPAAPARKVVPFLALPFPTSILDESPAESSTAPLKRPPLPKFELGGEERKGKLTAMTALEPPMIDLPEEKEVVGDALELQRGLLVSPEKGDRKRGRFVRNGLAERAQVLMNRSSTALVLWRKEMEPLALRPGRLNPDLRLRVKEIVHVSRNANVHSRASGALRTVLASCTMPNGDERRVLLSFGNEEHSSHSSPPTFDSEVLVWKPWQETKDPPMLFCSRFLVLSDTS